MKNSSQTSANTAHSPSSCFKDLQVFVLFHFLIIASQSWLLWKIPEVQSNSFLINPTQSSTLAPLPLWGLCILYSSSRHKILHDTQSMAHFGKFKSDGFFANDTIFLFSSSTSLETFSFNLTFLKYLHNFVQNTQSMVKLADFENSIKIQTIFCHLQLLLLLAILVCLWRLSGVFYVPFMFHDTNNWPKWIKFENSIKQFNSNNFLQVRLHSSSSS